MGKNPETIKIQVTHKYDDIIHTEYPLKSADRVKHPGMTISDRAKIFAPFAALKGYEEVIAAVQKIVVPRMELSEESREHLDQQLMQMEQILQAGEHPMVRVVYFQKDRTIDEEDNGEYIQYTGKVAKYDAVSRVIQIVEKRIELADIYELEIGWQFGEMTDR